MPRTGLGPEELRSAILDAAEKIIRRHGVARTRLVDIAGSIGVHHSLLYRSFHDKAELIDAVAARRLASLRNRVARGIEPGGPVVRRIKNWFVLVHGLMSEWSRSDPELFDLYRTALTEGRAVAHDHDTQMRWQLTKLVAEAIQNGEFNEADPLDVAMLLFDATALFHGPGPVVQPDSDIPSNAGKERLAKLLDIMIAGLAARADRSGEKPELS